MRLSWLALAASRIRSSSSSRCFSNSAITSRGLRRRPSAHNHSIRSAATFSSATSCAMILVMPGRNILTATSRPSGSTAKCTCATDALATGVSSKLWNTSRNGFAVSGFQHRDGLRGREWRHLILQLGKFVGDVGRYQVAARGQHLAELDEDRPERFQRQAQPHRARLGRCCAGTAACSAARASSARAHAPAGTRPARNAAPRK